MRFAKLRGMCFYFHSGLFQLELWQLHRSSLGDVRSFDSWFVKWHEINAVVQQIESVPPWLKAELSRPDLSCFFYVSILGWSGRELGWAFYVLFCVCISMCLAWYGSQSEAAVNRCLWLRTILRQPGFALELWVVVLCVSPDRTVSFSLFLVVILFSVQFWFNFQHEHLPRCVLVYSFSHQRKPLPEPDGAAA